MSLQQLIAEVGRRADWVWRVPPLVDLADRRRAATAL
jgi:hypothetical protein